MEGGIVYDACPTEAKFEQPAYNLAVMMTLTLLIMQQGMMFPMQVVQYLRFSQMLSATALACYHDMSHVKSKKRLSSRTRNATSTLQPQTTGNSTSSCTIDEGSANAAFIRSDKPNHITAVQELELKNYCICSSTDIGTRKPTFTLPNTQPIGGSQHGADCQLWPINQTSN